MAATLDIVGSRWALLVVRELVLGPRRFGQIESGLETAAADMVASRLRALVAAGVVNHTDDRRYELTTSGFGLVPTLRTLSDWTLSQRHGEGIPDLLPDVDIVRRLMAMLAIFGRTTLCPADRFTRVGSVGLTCDDVTVIARPEPRGESHVSFVITDEESHAVDDTTSSTTRSTAVTHHSAHFRIDGLATFALSQTSLSTLIANNAVEPSDDTARAFLEHLTGRPS